MLIPKIFEIIKTPKLIKVVFHFGEFARIYQSFIQMDKCINSNSIGQMLFLILFNK